MGKTYIFQEYLRGRSTVISIPRNSTPIDIRYDSTVDENPTVTFIGDVDQRRERATVRMYETGSPLPEMPSYYLGRIIGRDGTARFVFMEKG